ncbi:MAG: LuxR family transcriptional regulator, partial [Anaerolineae bacterium]|nr:LuxR family transcriptional regulator [Anaerolineae bacterium]
IEALEQRTEGWVVGLQLAALSMQGQQDTHQFIRSFTGSHHFVLDYLIEEVLNHQPSHIQDFLLKTSILDQMCGPLCDAILQDASHSGATTLESIRQANLFLIPLDNERRWYRYHHLFGDLLRKRLGQSTQLEVNMLHNRASAWYEANGFELEAFQHAIASNDIERAERLIESQGTPLYLRGIVKPILQWLESLPHHILDAHPLLWIAYASTLLLAGQHTSVEQKLNEAENALHNAGLDDTVQDTLGRIASMRATLAVIQNDVEAMISQSNDALARLHPENLPSRIAAYWTLGYAYQLQGHHRLARKAYEDVLQLSESGEKSFYFIVATISLGQLQELDNQLLQASESYLSAIELSGEPSHPIASEAFLGLARINYQWNDLESAQEYGQQCHELLQRMENTDTTASYKVFLAYLHMSKSEFTSASDVLDEAEAFVRQNNFMFRMPDIAEAQVRVLIHRDHLTPAMELAEAHNLSISQTRIHLAQQNASRALQILDPFIQKAKERELQNECLQGLVLKAIIYQALNQQDIALEVLDASLALAKRGEFIRIFVDEGIFMKELLTEAVNQKIFPNYSQKLLMAFEDHSSAEASLASQSLIDPLSERELEVLRLVAEGLSNREVSKRLFVALDTVKGHNRNIYQKLQVKRRTEAVARARELGLI